MPSPLLTDARTEQDVADDTPVRNREFYLDAFLAALRIEPVLFKDLNGEAFAAAVAASESFAQLRLLHPALDRHLTDRDREARITFEGVNERLERALTADDADGHRELTFAYQEIEQNWNIIALLPGGPYEDLIKRIVQDLEPQDGAGSLSQEDQSLFRVAHRIADLMLASQRNSHAEWSRLEKGLDEAGQALDVADDNITPFPNIAKSNRID